MASAVSAVLDNREAYLRVCYDQWWTSRVAGSTTGHTYYLVEKKPSLVLSRLYIESLPVSKEGGGDQQMMPELLNEAFSAKATQQKPQQLQ